MNHFSASSRSGNLRKTRFPGFKCVSSRVLGVKIGVSGNLGEPFYTTPTRARKQTFVYFNTGGDTKRFPQVPQAQFSPTKILLMAGFDEGNLKTVRFPGRAKFDAQQSKKVPLGSPEGGKTNMNELKKVPLGSPNVVVSNYERDPRPDLTEDHSYWVVLLTFAKKENQSVFGILHSLRCGGAKLIKDPKTGLYIVPGEWEPAQYKEYKTKYLRPNVGTIKNLLLRVSREDIRKITTREDVIARVKAIETKALALGWTDQEIWAEKEFETHGWRSHSIFASLMLDPYAEITEVTSEYVEFTYRYPSGYVAKNRLYRRPQIINVTPTSSQSQASATSKKEVI